MRNEPKAFSDFAPGSFQRPHLLTNTPGLSAIPLIQMIISKSGSNIESVIDTNVPKTRKKVQSIPIYEHTCKSHHPQCHDPKCDACMRARMMAKSNTSNEDDLLVVRGSEKGYAHSMDYVGPYSPDVDGNIYGLVGVETGHTNYGITSRGTAPGFSTRHFGRLIYFI